MTAVAPYRRLRLAAAAALAAALAAGCAPPRKAPVVERTPQVKPAVPARPAVTVRPAPHTPDARAGFHVVRKGDTLYSIALNYGLDYKDLAEWNQIDPERIHVGQQLRLAPPPPTVIAAPIAVAPGTVEARPLDAPGTDAAAGNVRSEPKGVRAPYSAQTYAQLAAVKPDPRPVTPGPEPRPDAAQAGHALEWIWPASGRVINSFSDSGNQKGISIAGKLGQPVFATAPGRVIFSGEGIRGFGKLIVIRHNDTFLSVYAHNSQLLVKEGQHVARGQKIAEMGNSDTDQVKLHFEIRRFGKPVDPIRLLPDRPA
jgi:lipoprotein NlpD